MFFHLFFRSSVFGSQSHSLCVPFPSFSRNAALAFCLQPSTRGTFPAALLAGALLTLCQDRALACPNRCRLHYTLTRPPRPPWAAIVPRPPLTVHRMALLSYLFCSWFSASFVMDFVVIVMLLAFDFWTVKNVSGRLLVGTLANTGFDIQLWTNSAQFRVWLNTPSRSTPPGGPEGGTVPNRGYF